MKNLTTPQAILCGFALIALAIATIPYSSNIVTPAHAAGGVQKVAICTQDGATCATVLETIDALMQPYGYLAVKQSQINGRVISLPK